MEQASEVGRELDVRPPGLVAARAVVEAHLGEAAGVRGLAGEVLSDNTAEQGGPATIQANLALGLLELSLGERPRSRHQPDRGAVRSRARRSTRTGGLPRARPRGRSGACHRGREARDADGHVSHRARRAHRTSLEPCRGHTHIRPRGRVPRRSQRGAGACGALKPAPRSAADAVRTSARDARAGHHRATFATPHSRRRHPSKARSICSMRSKPACGRSRARAELERVGLRRQVSVADELTPSEARVAGLAARGLTTREIASELFMSPKTVEANLTRIYRKLGVRSRSALAARMHEREAGKSRQNCRASPDASRRS